MNDDLFGPCHLVKWLSNPRKVLKVLAQSEQRKSEDLGKCFDLCRSNALIVERYLSQKHFTIGRQSCFERVCAESWNILENSGSSQMWHLKQNKFSSLSGFVALDFVAKAATERSSFSITISPSNTSSKFSSSNLSLINALRESNEFEESNFGEETSLSFSLLSSAVSLATDWAFFMNLCIW